MSSAQTASTSNPSGQSTPATTAYSADPSSAGVAAPNGQSEGTAGADSHEAESSKQAELRVDMTGQAVNLAAYIFNVGYASRQWADVILSFFGDTHPFHRIILARSPYLAGLLDLVRPGSTVHLRFEDESITNESVHIALHHLYSPAHHLVNPSNARAVLATALLFEGMPELADQAFGIIRQSVSVENVQDLIAWVSTPPVQGRGGFGPVGNGSGADGFAWDGESPGRYGHYTSTIKRDVIDFLSRQLPSQASPSDLSATYARLPFALFKRCVESPDFSVGSGMQDRFAFAKKVIAARKKAASASGVEEVAVLAFKGGDGMEVVVTRKPKKRTALYKVEG